jgi:transglutaminase-like putative cysteine protease
MIDTRSPVSPEAEDLASSWLTLLLNRVGRGALLQLSLLVIIGLVLVYNLAGLVRDLHVSQLLPLATLALLAGWVMADRPAKRWGSWLTLVLGSLLGLIGILLREGGLWDETWSLILTLNQASSSMLQWAPGQPLPDTAPAAALIQNILSGLIVLLARAFHWLGALIARQPEYDPVAAALVWGLGVWVVSFWASWSLRHQFPPLAAALPTLVVLGAALSAANASWIPLIPVLAAVLALMGAAAYARHELTWEREQVDFSEELRLDVGLAVTSLVALLVMAAALAGFFSVERINRWVENLVPRTTSEVPWSESLGVERQPDPRPVLPSPAPQSGGVIQTLRAGGMPRDHLLGSGPELQEEIVMWISTGDFPPGPAEMISTAYLPRYYWRSLTYDIYTKRGWITSASQRQTYDPGEAVLSAGLPSQRLVRQSVTPAVDLGGLIYSAGDLSTVDQPFQIEWRRRPDSQNLPDFFGATLSIPASGYTVEGWVGRPSPAELRQAGSAYPEHIARRYLALPEGIPDRVRQLALQLTATQPNPFDRAAAIESYLRQNYTYSLEVDLPPSQLDVVDYFLFDLRAGYCDYYASSMVVLARLSGLPARLAVGYAPGTYNPHTARYAVTAADAHSWPEIYFPDYGWIIFEPTVSQAPFQSGAPTSTVDPSPEQSSQPFARSWGSLLVWIALGLAVLLALPVIWQLAEPLRLSLLPPGQALATLYARLEEWAPQLGLALPTGHTPAEFAAALEAVFLPRQGTKTPIANVLSLMLTPASGESHAITELYARSAYSPHPLRKQEKRQALRLWSRLRWRLLLKGTLLRMNGKGT